MKNQSVRITTDVRTGEVVSVEIIDDCTDETAGKCDVEAPKFAGIFGPKPAPEAIGDGKLLELLMQYLPQILDILLKFGVIKPKTAADAVTIAKFGDGELLKKLLPLLIQLLPLFLMFLGKEQVGKPTDEPV